MVEVRYGRQHHNANQIIPETTPKNCDVTAKSEVELHCDLDKNNVQQKLSTDFYVKIEGDLSSPFQLPKLYISQGYC